MPCRDRFFPCAPTGNLPDPGKAQDFVKKLAQVLDDDERIRDQLETLVSPSCSCKQAEVCVVSTDAPGQIQNLLSSLLLLLMNENSGIIYSTSCNISGTLQQNVFAVLFFFNSRGR